MSAVHPSLAGLIQYRPSKLADFGLPASETAAEAFINVTHWRGHRLPLRLELAFDDVAMSGDWHQLIEEDQRVVRIDAGFEQSRLIMEEANATMAKRYVRCDVLRGDQLSIPHRVNWLHPCHGHPARVDLAFECIVNRRHLRWIDNTTLGNVIGVGVVNADMSPKKAQVDRFHDWRLAENAALRRRRML